MLLLNEMLRRKTLICLLLRLRGNKAGLLVASLEHLLGLLGVLGLLIRRHYLVSTEFLRRRPDRFSSWLRWWQLLLLLLLLLPLLLLLVRVDCDWKVLRHRKLLLLLLLRLKLD